MLELKSTGKEVKREVIATVDGTELSIPETFSAAFALRYTDMVSRRGIDAAVSWLLETALGVDGYNALLSFDELTAEDVAQIVSILEQRVHGAMDIPKGELKAV